MSTTIPETIKDPEVFLSEIEKDIPDTTIIEDADDPPVIAPIQMTPVTGYGTPVQSQITYNQHADTSQKETASSRKLQRNLQTNIQQEATSTHTEQGGDTISTVIVRPTLNFSITIPVSLQVS